MFIKSAISSVTFYMDLYELVTALYIYIYILKYVYEYICIHTLDTEHIEYSMCYIYLISDIDMNTRYTHIYVHTLYMYMHT